MFIHEEIDDLPIKRFHNLFLESKKETLLNNTLYYLMYNNLFYRHWNTTYDCSQKDREQLLENIYNITKRIRGDTEEVICILFDKSLVTFVGSKNTHKMYYRQFKILIELE